MKVENFIEDMEDMEGAEDSGVVGFSPDRYLFRGNNLVYPPNHAPIVPVPTSYWVELAGIDTLTIPGKGGKIHLGEVPPDVVLPPAWQTIPVRHIFTACPSTVAAGSIGAAITGGPDSRHLTRLLRAYHILQWRQESRFCGRCGAENANSPTELARVCPACGRVEYPRICPAIIVLVTNDKGEALLAHNAGFAPGVYSLIAGFNEAGETLEATVIREVHEEVGLDIRDIRYVRSQPWPFPNSLMVGFTARYAGGGIKVDGVEIEDARWFDPKNLPALPGPGSVARAIINRWLFWEVSRPLS